MDYFRYLHLSERQRCGAWHRWGFLSSESREQTVGLGAILFTTFVCGIPPLACFTTQADCRRERERKELDDNERKERVTGLLWGRVLQRCIKLSRAPDGKCSLVWHTMRTNVLSYITFGPVVKIPFSRSLDYRLCQVATRGIILQCMWSWIILFPTRRMNEFFSSTLGNG